MYIVFKLKEQQKKAENHYEKCFFPFFSDEFSNDTLPKLLIRKCCLFIWYQNRSFKSIFEVIFLGFVLFNSHLLKTKVNCQHSLVISRQLLLHFGQFRTTTFIDNPTLNKNSTSKSATPLPPPKTHGKFSITKGN